MTPDVVLVCMPFAAIERPSIGLGLLQALLRRAGVSCLTMYGNLRLAERVGAAHCQFWEEVLGELLFARAAFPRHDPLIEGHVRAAFAAKARRARALGITGADLSARVRGLQREAAALVDEMADEIVASGARIVGCTSTYWQHTASLALLRRLHERGLVTMLGGANCEADMGRATHASFAWVDFVVSGEADDFIGTFCCDVLRCGRDLAEVPPGVLGPAHRVRGYPQTRGVCRTLASLPTPSYDDYFAALERSGLRDFVRPGLPFETARGCWYGERRQCRFCGISEAGIAWRSKPAERVLAELDELEARHRVSDFEATDLSLDVRYFKTVLPSLEGRGRRFFWETRANLRRGQLETLARAGVRWIQPGVESLDTRALRLMDKGLGALQNVRLLKWCRELGVRLSWNLLYGLPGEDDAWYAEMAARVPLLEHLQPPGVMTRMRYDRFSPWHRAAELEGVALSPLPVVRLAYEVPEQRLHEMSYFFTAREASPGPGVRLLEAAVDRWRQAFWRPLAPILCVRDDGERLHFLDTRTCAVERTWCASGARREAYLACEDGGLAAGDEADALRAHGVVADIDGKCLGLALRGDVPTLPGLDEFPGGHVSEAAPARRHPGQNIETPTCREGCSSALERVEDLVGQRCVEV